MRFWSAHSWLEGSYCAGEPHFWWFVLRSSFVLVYARNIHTDVNPFPTAVYHFSGLAFRRGCCWMGSSPPSLPPSLPPSPSPSPSPPPPPSLSLSLPRSPGCAFSI